MKNIIPALLAAPLMLLGACGDFESVNTDPSAALPDQVRAEYLLNKSVIQAQMNPDVAERAFILYWKTAGRQHRSGGLSNGSYDDGFSTNYYAQVAEWLSLANQAIETAQMNLTGDIDLPYTPELLRNQIQMARVWRAYLMSEFSDNFGPMPLDGFKGVNPAYSDVESVYRFILTELKDAAATIDTKITAKDFAKYDAAYGYDFAKWQKYANSLRLRLAMRLSEVDPATAQAEFEDAARGPLLLAAADQFKVTERPGWDALTGVMSREWNAQMISATQNNIFIGLGGIETATSMPAYAPYVKEADWMGVKYDQHFSSITNDPSAGFWYDGLHPVIDPRAYTLYVAPGDTDNPDFSRYPSWNNTATTTKMNLVDADGKVVKEIEAKFTWNAAPLGDWGDKGARNQVYNYNGTNPRMSSKFRMSTAQRIFFAEWETCFLLAEGAVRGWAIPAGMTAQSAYESGVRASFDYWGLGAMATAYLASESYNRVGTSVSWAHTAEPSGTRAMRYTDGYTGTEGVYDMPLPVNTLYKNGTVRNDLLTKIITQKFIAQAPWLPLETWNDHRRLGLPFFENPCVEKPLIDMPALTAANATAGNSVAFFPQRIKYPSGLQNSNPEGYSQAVSLLGAGGDAVLTPLWWAKH